MFECHCRDCQQAGGGAFSPVVYVPATSFKLTKGTIRHYGTPSRAGGHNKRGFCGGCGSRISGGETPDGIGILAGSLDDPSWFRPQMHMFVADAQPWDVLGQAVPRFDEYASQ
jgi:hypothetical protein